MPLKSDIEKITLEGSASPFWKREQTRALEDIEQTAKFELTKEAIGPYHVALDIEKSKLVLSIFHIDETPITSFILSLSPYKKVIRDYFMLIESYEAVRGTGSIEKLEAIDMGRRSLHNEGAEKFQERLSDRLTVNHETARRFFTLICALYDKRFNRLTSFHR